MMRLTLEIDPSFTLFVFLSHPLLVYAFVLIPSGSDAIAPLLCEGSCGFYLLQITCMCTRPLIGS